MNSFISLKKRTTIVGSPAQLPSSKSISNRALILDALSGNRSVLHNLSEARDTKLMQALVGSADKTINVLDAGTTMRFLTAYFAVTNQNKILTGTDRMKERPIQLLVDALRNIGASIDYLENHGFPPIEISSFREQKANTVKIPGNVSSQYISALMMVAPNLPNGLTIELSGNIGSWPYINMTASLMTSFGLSCEFQSQKILIPKGNYEPAEITIEADWSAASYWFAFVALAERAEITLNNISMESLQGDRVIVDVMDPLGVKSVFSDGKLTLTKQPHQTSLSWDFKDCPDLAQTVLPVCAAKNIKGTFVGLESLRIKETDRIAALQTELRKIGASLSEPVIGNWNLETGPLPTHPVTFRTYHDHRMAMGLAALATVMDISFDDSSVINKSYPGFWDDCRSIGFVVD